MQMLRFGVPILLLFFQFTFGQASGEKMIHGKIVVVSGAVEGVNIVNLVNEKSTTSDSNGDFFILAATMKHKTILLLENELVQANIPCYIPMKENQEQLDDRIIDKKIR
jgi:hypothetical protein